MARRLLLLAFAVLLSAAFAYADVDPRIEISEPPCQSGDTDVTSLVNGFAAVPISGGGVFNFCNKTGVDWYNVLVTIHTTAPASSITCPSSSPSDPNNTAGLAFIFCFVNQVDPTTVNAFFTGVVPPYPPSGFQGFPGVPNLSRFTLDLDCHSFGGCEPWPDGTTMTGSANVDVSAIPEPATMALLSTGLVTGLLRRKRRG